MATSDLVLVDTASAIDDLNELSKSFRRTQCDEIVYRRARKTAVETLHPGMSKCEKLSQTAVAGEPCRIRHRKNHPPNHWNQYTHTHSEIYGKNSDSLGRPVLWSRSRSCRRLTMITAAFLLAGVIVDVTRLWPRRPWLAVAKWRQWSPEP